MRTGNNRVMWAAAIAGCVLAPFIDGSGTYAMRQSTPQKAASAVAAGTATGTLTVGAAKFPLSHVYAVPSQQHYRIFLTNQALTAAAMKLAASAGSDAEARQQLAVELNDHKVYGLEVVVTKGEGVVKAPNAKIYCPDAALGMMVLEPTQFQATTFDAQQVAGRLFTEKPIQDGRISKTFQYDATFSAQIKGAAK